MLNLLWTHARIVHGWVIVATADGDWRCEHGWVELADGEVIDSLSQDWLSTELGRERRAIACPLILANDLRAFIKVFPTKHPRSLCPSRWQVANELGLLL